jgi:hypothetical protein
MEHYASTVENPWWLANHKFVHIGNEAEQLLTQEPVLNFFTDLSEEHNAVHALYRASFTDANDRHDMLLAIEIAHTILIVEIDETEFLVAVGAITFMYTKANGIVL